MQTIIRKLFYINAMMLAVATSPAFAASIFAVTPSIITNTISANGMAVVKYTVTNNSSKTINQITVNPAFQSGGASLLGASLQNDSCSNATLASQASCTFQLVLSGTQQTATVTLSPKICAFNGSICSIPVASLRTQVTIVPAQTTPAAYFSLYNVQKLQPVLTSTNALQLSIPGFNFASLTGIAVSQDGTKVYAANTGAHNLIIYNVTQGTTTTVPLALSLHSSQNKSAKIFLAPQAVAVTPDGSKVYITDGANGVWVYNTASGKMIANITDATYLSDPASIVVSPDGAFVYVANQEPLGLRTAKKRQSHVFPVSGYVTVINTATNTITNHVDMVSPIGIAVSPDGTQLYVVSSILISFGPSPATSNLKILNSNDLSTVATVSLTGLGAHFVAIAPNGNTAYVTDSIGDISVINLSTLTHSEISLIFAPYGIAVTPDGSKTFFSSTDTTNIGILYTNTGQVSYVNVGDEQGTFGNFIG